MYRVITKLQWALVWLANHLESRNRTPSHWPPFRRVDSKQLENIGTKYSCDAYSYEHIASLLQQYKDDGLGEPKLSWLISEDGWVEITEDNAEEMTSLINDSFEKESNRQERKRTMKAAGLSDER